MMSRRKDGSIPSGVILLHQRRKRKKKIPLKKKLKSRKKPKKTSRLKKLNQLKTKLKIR